MDSKAQDERQGARFKRLAIVTHEFLPFAGGIATYTDGIARAVSDNGIAVSVMAPRGTAAAGAPYAVKAILRHHHLSLGSFLRAFWLLLRGARDELRFGVDVRSVILLRMVQLVSGRPYGVMVHGSELLKLSGPGLSKRVARAAYRHALFAAANSHATARLFHLRIGEHPAARVTHLGVECHWFERETGAFASAELRAFAAAGPYVCTVGRLEPRKGHRGVLQAIAQLRQDKRAELGYVVAGPTIDAAYRHELAQLARQLGVPLHLAGVLSRPDLKRLYANSVSHVLAAAELPGKLEGFGLVLLEAAAQNCPSIATCVGGIPEVIAHARTGLLVADGDQAALAQALASLAGDGDLRDRLGKAACEHAGRFTWQACARATFTDILDSRF